MGINIALFVLASLAAISLVLMSQQLKPVEVGGQGSPYLIYHPLKPGKGFRIAGELNQKRVLADVIMRVQGSLPYEVLEASGEASHLRTHLNDTGIDIRNFHLAVDILGVDGRLARSLAGRDDFLMGDGCLVSEPLFKALKGAYGTRIGDSIRIEVYTGSSIESFTCRVVGTFPKVSFMLSDMVMTGRSHLSKFLSNHGVSAPLDEMVVVYVDDPDDLDGIRGLLPCGNCLFPLSSLPS